MSCSTKLLERLVLETSAASVEDDSIAHLIYWFLMPGTTVPMLVADILADRPALSSSRSYLPIHLAFGTVEETFTRVGFDTERLARICRQVGFVKLYLMKAERSGRVVDDFRARLREFEDCVFATQDLASERPLSNPELAGLVERLIIAATSRVVSLKKLVAKVGATLDAAEKRRLLVQVGKALEQGLTNMPWNDCEEEPQLLINLEEPVRFRKSLHDSPSFIRVARQLEIFLADALQRARPHQSLQ